MSPFVYWCGFAAAAAVVAAGANSAKARLLLSASLPPLPIMISHSPLLPPT